MANELARHLRKRMTPQEVKLWVHLRALRELGFHFRRQSPRDGCILDFVCLRARLIVEVDGGLHNFDAHARIDRKRDRRFDANGFRTLRFWNNEVDKNMQGVIELILDELARRSPPTPALRADPPP